MEIVLIAHSLRSSYNIGSIARTCDGFGLKQIYCTGITPYIHSPSDDRSVYARQRVIRSIEKTALGAEKTVRIDHHSNLHELIDDLAKQGYKIYALEQSNNSTPLINFSPHNKIVLIVGNEINGLDNEVLSRCQQVLELPMLGNKESYNVAVATAIAIYELKRLELY